VGAKKIRNWMRERNTILGICNLCRLSTVFGGEPKNNASHMHNSIYFTLLDEFSFERGKSETNHRLSLSKPGGIFQDLLIRIGCKKLRMETGRKSQSL
jgi:hypothetical protein